MIPKICCFTGHRIISRTEIETVTTKLEAEIRKAIQNGVDTYICGGALGFDMIAANFISCFKEMGQNIKLVLILPCKNQDRYWSIREQEIYRHILSSADEIKYMADRYHDDCMKKRNQQMITLTDLCIAYLRNKTSGTAQTVRMAKAKGIPVVKL